MGFRSELSPSDHLPSPPPSGHDSVHHHGHHHGLSYTDFILIITIPTFFICLMIGIFVFFVCFFRTSKSEKSSSNNGNINKGKIEKKLTELDARNCLYGDVSRSSSTKFGGGQVFTFRQLALATDKFSQGNVIGNGGFGVVYRGVLADGTVAAVKRLNGEGKHGERDFRMEVDLLSRLHSPYVVQLLGYCADQQHRLLVFEFMTNGNLEEHLYSNGQEGSPPLLDWETRMRIALDCAKGLEYLHEHMTPVVIHRDFKSSNVLLDGDYRAKVSDFGLAKTGSDKINGLISTRVLGTTGYVAPEYASTGKLTTKSDVYSFGVVLLELITGRVPIDTKRPPGEQSLVSWALPRLTSRDKVAQMVDPALEGQYSIKELIQVAAIAAMCVQPEADYRPLITDVVQSLVPLVKHRATASIAKTPKLHHQIITLKSSSIDSGSSGTSINSPCL
ncbi:Serine/threonine-protein kinase [Nymphaea thermarum]|nr:Serine/threonine-protein kinase [Nymphaea thermarum]